MDFFPSLDRMVEDWELKELGRRIDFLEREWTRAEEEKQRRSERRSDLTMAAMWTLYVAALTAMIVLGVMGVIHHHH